jgi:hydrogenase expression/formation protein HypE
MFAKSHSTSKDGRAMIEDTHVTLAHGNGGRRMRELIEEIFAHHLANPSLNIQLDAVPLDLAPGMVPWITTDTFTVKPLEFPGGDIGSLAVNGTINDLAVSGAEPRFLTLNAIIEEGLEMERLDRVVRSLADAARAGGVRVVAGDTKVVPRGQGGGLYFVTTGVGLRPPGRRLGMDRIRDGDVVLISGPAGDHGIAVMLAREEFELKGSVQSDCAAVTPLTAPLATIEGLRFMRDPTRGGLATVAHEIAAATGLIVRLSEAHIPVRDSVRSFCQMLGYDPYYLACEGRVVAVAAPDAAPDILAIWQSIPDGQQASTIGTLCGGGRGRVILETEIGGERFLEELEDDPLPRIC